MDPITMSIIIGALAGAGSSAASGIPVLVRTPYDKRLKSKAEELQALEEAGLLGLSRADERNIRQGDAAQVSKAISDVAPIGQAGLESGQIALRDMALAREATQLRSQAASKTDAKVRELDRAIETANKAELENVLGQRDQRTREKIAAALSIVSGAGEGAVQGSSFGQMVGPAPKVGTPLPNTVVPGAYDDIPEDLLSAYGSEAWV